jgi:GntR family transcriptional regulator
MPRRPVKAEQIADAVALRISEGVFAPQTWLPTLRELSQDPRTISSALAVLVERGLVELVPGQGARVLGRPVRRSPLDITCQVGSWRDFHTAASNTGAEPYTDTFHIGDIEASPEVAGRLGIPVTTPLLERARLQGLVVDGERQPVQLSTSWIIHDVVEQLPILREVNTGPGGMGSRMAEIGYELVYEDVVTTRMPAPEERDRLVLPQTQPVMVAWRRAFDQTGRALEVTLRVINPHRHELVYRYA